jgi:hypothetical protein
VRWSWRWRQALWDPRVSPLLFFLAAYLFGISINLASSRIGQAGNWSEILLYGGPALVLLVILAPAVVGRWFRDEVRATARYERHPRHHKWLIALASPEPGIETAEKAIYYHLPALEKVWLLCSEKGEKESKPAAMALREKLARKEILSADRCELVVLSVEEFNTPQKVLDAIEAIYAALPEDLPPREVMIDITGGTKPATAGAFLAGLPPGRHLEYVPPVPGQVSEDGRGLKPDDPVQIEIDYTIKKVKSP